MVSKVASPIHETIPNEQSIDPSNKELAERIVVAALGVISALGTFFAVLILGAPFSFAAGTAILIGGSISLITYLNFQDQNECQKIQQEIDRQLQLNADFSQQLRDQKVREEAETIAFIQEAVKKFNQKKAECEQSFSTRNLDDPLIRKIYESQSLLINYKLNLAFMRAHLLSVEAKARVLAPYQAEYSHLMQS